MSVKKKEHGSLTGSKRYAAEKNKTVEEQSQENHAKAVEKIKARFQKPENAVNAVADGVRTVAQIAEWLMKYLSNGIDVARIKILDNPQDVNLAGLKHLDIAA